MTNTNQSVHFLRNPALDATTGIDGVYANPAGLIFLTDGLHFSLNNQSAYQTRTTFLWRSKEQVPRPPGRDPAPALKKHSKNNS